MFKPVRFLTTASLALIVGVPALANAQDGTSDWAPWRWEVRLDLAKANERLAGTDLDSGGGLVATMSYAFTRNFGVYGGVNYYNFSSDQSFAGFDVNFVDGGYSLGLQLLAGGTPSSKLGFRARAGLTYNEIRVLEDIDNDIADSRHGLGWEVRLAMLIELPNRWQLTPELAYRSLSRDLRVRGVTTAVDLRYTTLGLGFGRSF